MTTTTTDNQIDRQSIVSQVPNLLTSEIDDEIVLLNMTTEKYHGMDAVGARIWQLLAQPSRISELCDQLLGEFDVDRATCEEDLLEYVQRLMDAKLVQIVQT